MRENFCGFDYPEVEKRFSNFAKVVKFYLSCFAADEDQNPRDTLQKPVKLCLR